jgi:hypothetical protein
MSNNLNQAAVVGPPISASGAQDVDATADKYGVLCLATTASSQRVNCPMKWKGRWWTIQAKTLDIDIVFGQTVTVALDQVSTVASNVVTLNAQTGITIFAGTSLPVFVPKTAQITDFAFIASGTSGFLKIYPSDNPPVGSN